MSKTDRQGPVIVDLDDQSPPSPADAPPVPDQSLPQTPVQVAATFGARRPSALTRWFWRLLVTLLGFGISVAAWNYVTGLITQNTYLGYAVLGLLAAFVAVCLLIALREAFALMRLSRVDRLQKEAQLAWDDGDLKRAKAVTKDALGIYRGRADTEWGRERFAEQQAEIFDADGLLGAFETQVLQPLDQVAIARIEAASRQVATVTALVPVALADVVTALTANLRMIRSIAEIYGGRGGTLGSLRLTRSVLTHLVATGAVAIGDDMVGSFAGGGLLSKFSRRFGEGVINGALTARVGVAAMEVCRPLPFQRTTPPSVSALLTRALAGLFGGTSQDAKN